MIEDLKHQRAVELERQGLAMRNAQEAESESLRKALDNK